MNKTELHAYIVQAIGSNTEALKNAIPDNAPDRMARRAELNEERNEAFRALHRYLWGKKNQCIGCPYYSFFADWLCDTDEFRIPIVEQYIADRKRKHQVEQEQYANKRRR